MPFIGGESIGKPASTATRRRVRRQPVATPQPRQVAMSDQQWIEMEPCRHRRGKSDTPAVCQSCGERGNPLQLYHCDLHGEVSIKRKNRSFRACANCDDRSGPS